VDHVIHSKAIHDGHGANACPSQQFNLNCIKVDHVHGMVALSLLLRTQIWIVHLFMDAQNIFSYCVGGLALITTISSVLFYCGLYLPANQLKLLDELLIETKNIYHKANDEGLLPAKASRYAQTRLRRSALMQD
jgi:hypothetical protein